MKHIDVKTKKVGEICKKSEFGCMYNDSGVINIAPCGDNEMFVQQVFCTERAIVFNTEIPHMDDYEDLWAFSKTILELNNNQLFGKYLLDMENGKVSYRSAIYCKDADQIPVKLVKFHVKMGFALAMKFSKALNEQDSESASPDEFPIPERADRMYV